MDEVVVGMAHRGRLNVLANIVGKSFGQIFSEFEGNLDPRTAHGSGDVKYHLGAEGTYTALDGETVKVTLTSNPSHLETVDPVVEGIARAKQDLINRGEGGFTVLPILIHGDAAFAGQGVVAETLNLSQLRGYRTGGSVHVVINNQVGFTTSPASARSSVYSTDVARMIQAPIFHVNGDDPEAVVRVAELAYEFRQAFKKDVVIDMLCYRRRGHSEVDEPSFTQPVMYDLIDAKRSVRKLYTESLIGRGDITVEEAEAALRDYQGQLERVFAESREISSTPAEAAGRRRRSRPTRTPRSPSRCSRRSATARSRCRTASRCTRGCCRSWRSVPQMVSEGGIDWAMGETIAIGSLLLDGHPVRLAGQDTRRGTFGQRHSVIVDRRTAAEHTPLAHLSDDQAPFYVYDSLLSRVRRDGLRVRLLGRATRGARRLGGAVRRLRQRRAGGHRRVHLGERGEVGPALQRRPAAAARLRGPGTGPLLRAHRAVPRDVGRGQLDHRDAEHPGELLPPATPPGAVRPPQAARGLHPEVDAAAARRDVDAGGLHERALPAGDRRPDLAGSRRPSPGCGCAAARSTTTWSSSARSCRPTTPRSSGSSSSTRCRSRRSATRSRRTRTPRTSPGSRRSRPTRARGRSSRSTCRSTSSVGTYLRRISRPASASPAAGSHNKHEVEQEELLAETFA